MSHKQYIITGIDDGMVSSIMYTTPAKFADVYDLYTSVNWGWSGTDCVMHH